MKILVVGLGLIGGSLCKAFKTYTKHFIMGCDNNPTVTRQAIELNSIDKVAAEDDFKNADITIICLHPDVARTFIESNISKFAKGSILCDVCGIKGKFTEDMSKLSAEHGIKYVGTHPMAGKEHFGFEYSDSELFINANFIVTPLEDTDRTAVNTVIELMKSVGFGKIVETSPYQHDRMIAYTSQLAHIVSSSYVKSPSIKTENGFSGGSFQDMTRVATMNESMWANLFLANKDCLLEELDNLISNLTDYRNALAEENKPELISLIRDGREIKEQNLRERLNNT